jgi:hypothetical protein
VKIKSIPAVVIINLNTHACSLMFHFRRTLEHRVTFQTTEKKVWQSRKNYSGRNSWNKLDYWDINVYFSIKNMSCYTSFFSKIYITWWNIIEQVTLHGVFLFWNKGIYDWRRPRSSSSCTYMCTVFLQYLK